MKVEKAIEISDARIQFVSLVDKAANKRQFLITKADDGQAIFSSLGKILKVDETTHYLTGIVYEPLVEDAHGNFMTEDEIRKAAYWFAKNGDNVDIQHSFKPAEGVQVVENYLAPCDMDVGGTPVLKGTWLMTVEVASTDIWDAVQKGKVTGFSMGGVGQYSETETELTEKAGWFRRLASIVPEILTAPNISKAIAPDAPVVKAGKKISSKNYDQLKSSYDTLGNLLSEFAEKEETEESIVTKQEVQAIVDESIKKALETAATPQTETSAQESAAEPITAEAVEKMVADAVLKATTPEEMPLTAEAVQSMVTEAVTKAVEPILKSRGMPSNIDSVSATLKPVEKHYLAGIL